MYYTKVKAGDTILEFHNDMWGVEYVIHKGRILSKKGSILGTSHFFLIEEDGHEIRYQLNTKINAHMGIELDLYRQGKLVVKNHPIPMQAKHAYGLAEKRKALKLLNEFDLEQAIKACHTALEKNPEDGELYFYLACAYSLLEDLDHAYDNLTQAIKYGIGDNSQIFDNDKLAYVRIQDRFEVFIAENGLVD